MTLGDWKRDWRLKERASERIERNLVTQTRILGDYGKLSEAENNFMRLCRDFEKL